MKKVLFLFGKSKFRKGNPFKDEKYQKVYETMYVMGEKRGVKMYRASYVWYDFDSKFFKKAWVFEKGKWVAKKNIRPDLIYDKSVSSISACAIKEKIGENYKIINDIDFSIIANNKFVSSLIFPEYFKKYHVIRNKKDLLKIIPLIKGDRIVIKPLIGSGGEGVLILTKQEAKKVKISEKVIVQEFIDSSAGIKGVVKGLHDLRLVFVNDDLIYSYIRQPSKGSLLANLAQGGSMFIVERKDIPGSVFKIVEKVQEAFKFYDPKIYTIDFIFDKKQRPWIVEFNTMPGLYFSEDQKDWQKKMYVRLIDTFKENM